MVERFGELLNQLCCRKPDENVMTSLFIYSAAKAIYSYLYSKNVPNAEMWEHQHYKKEKGDKKV